MHSFERGGANKALVVKRVAKRTALACTRYRKVSVRSCELSMKSVNTLANLLLC